MLVVLVKTGLQENLVFYDLTIYWSIHVDFDW